LVALIACLHLIGGHWLALQGFAWVSMFVDHSSEVGLGEAVSRTFDGEHPCDLCKTVAAGRSEERRNHEDLADPGTKLVAILAAEFPPPPPRESPLRFFPFSDPVWSIDRILPSPPPRAV